MNDSNSIEAPPQPRPMLKRVWIYILLALAIMLMVLIFLAVRRFFISLRPPAMQASRVVASFVADFQPEQPKQSWHYYWNDNGPVGDVNAYVELHWSGKNYIPNDTTSPAGRYVQLSNR